MPAASPDPHRLRLELDILAAELEAREQANGAPAAADAPPVPPAPPDLPALEDAPRADAGEGG